MRTGGRRSSPGVQALVVLVALAGALSAAAPALGRSQTGQLPDDATLASMVHNLRQCLHGLPAAEHRALVLRLGIGGGPRLTQAAVATQLGRSSTQEAAVELHALRALEAARRRGECSMRPAGSGSGATTAADGTTGTTAPAGVDPGLGRVPPGPNFPHGIAQWALVAVVILSFLGLLVTLGREIRGMRGY